MYLIPVLPAAKVDRFTYIRTYEGEPAGELGHGEAAPAVRELQERGGRVVEEVHARAQHHPGGGAVAEGQGHAVVGRHDERRQHSEEADGPVVDRGRAGWCQWGVTRWCAGEEHATRPTYQMAIV